MDREAASAAEDWPMVERICDKLEASGAELGDLEHAFTTHPFAGRAGERTALLGGSWQ